jgi:non-canonical poly(A) RNA polymerase PAPD5/7
MSDNNDNDKVINVSNCCCPNPSFPWAKKPFYEATMDGLNEQIQHFLAWIEPTQEERIMREDVCRRIEQVVTDIWSHARVETIGSTMTKLCVPTSDIDIVIFGVDIQETVSNDSNLQPLEHLYKLANKLEDLAQKNSVEVIETAKIPIIKFRDRKSSIDIDISFGVTTGKDNSKIVLEYCDKYPLVRPLTLVLKFYLKQKFLNSSWTGGIGSYTLVIMIISYLQRSIQKCEKSQELSLAEHLLGFLELYGSEFDYVESVVSILSGGKYISKNEKNWKNEKYPHLLSVEDPHNPDLDVGVFSFNIKSAKHAFYQAFIGMLDNKTQSTSSVLSPQDEEANKSVSDIMLSKPCQLFWVSYSLQNFRTRVKEVYRVPECINDDAYEYRECPVHPYRKISSLLTLSTKKYQKKQINTKAKKM